MSRNEPSCQGLREGFSLFLIILTANFDLLSRMPQVGLLNVTNKNFATDPFDTPFPKTVDLLSLPYFPDTMHIPEMCRDSVA